MMVFRTMTGILTKYVQSIFFLLSLASSPENHPRIRLKTTFTWCLGGLAGLDVRDW